MKRLLFLAATLLAVVQANVYAEEINISLNGEDLQSEQPPVVINDRTLVPVRVVCEALGLDVGWDEDTKQVTICDELNLVKLTIDHTTIDVNDELSELDAAPAIINDVTCVPLRAVVEPFGADVSWDAASRTVMVTVGEEMVDPTETEPEEEEENQMVITEKPFTFYYQSEEEWAFENSGRGYCWVCSYAMLISDILDEKVTPVDIANYNIELGGSSGSYMAGHFRLADKYGLKFVPALSEDSEYFDSFETERRGATYLKFETEEQVRAALIEALERNPHGIMVRFEGYPHTLVATGYYDGTVYFNDPASAEMENVAFEDTCLGKKYKLTDISFVQAMEVK